LHSCDTIPISNPVTCISHNTQLTTPTTNEHKDVLHSLYLSNNINRSIIQFPISNGWVPQTAILYTTSIKNSIN